MDWLRGVPRDRASFHYLSSKYFSEHLLGVRTVCCTPVTKVGEDDRSHGVMEPCHRRGGRVNTHLGSKPI